jgi:Tubulin like
MQNHYFIGIGGTGGNILREIKKTMFMRSSSTSIRAEFLYVDSNELELASNHGWRVLGNSVQLAPNQKLGILQGSIAETVNNVGQNPGITGWIGNRERLLNLVAGAAGVPGAQQRRRFGRFLFAVHTQEFIRRVRAGVQRILSSGDQVSNECTFHLMGTLAGGTGSGGVVDAILQLRKAFHSAATHPIKLYCLINDDAPAADVGYFYPNQYAALKDINAILCGKANFHDVISPHGDKVSVNSPLLVCYLTSHTNEDKVALTKERQERLIAEWIVEVTNSEAAGRMNHQNLKILTGEDILSSFAGEPTVNPERSYAFASLGIRRWAIPRDLLRERIALSVAKSLIDQLLFANWDNGYQAQPFALNTTTFLNNNPPETFGLRYQKFADPDANAGSSIESEYNIAVNNSKQRVIGEPDAFSQLEQQAASYRRTGFQSKGVEAFFASKEAQLGGEVSTLVGNLCGQLKDAMARGELGLADTIGCLEFYLQRIAAELAMIDSEEAERRRLGDQAQRRLADLRSSFSRVGFLGRLFGANKRLLEQASVAIAVDLSSSTWLVGCSHARNALQQIKATVQNVLSSCVGFRAALDAARIKLADKRLQVINHLQHPGDLMKALWNTQSVDVLESCILADRTQNDSALRKVHDELVGKRALWDLGQLQAEGELILDSLERIGDEAGRSTHDKIAAVDPSKRILDENIVTALQREFSTQSEALGEEVKAFVKGAVTALKLNSAAVQPMAVLGGDAVPQMPKQGILLLIPRSQANADFRNTLVDLFEGCITGDLVVEESDDTSEITLVAANRWLAARFADSLVPLKSKYSSAMRNAQLAADYFCHLDDESQKLPDLFPPDTEVVRAESLRWVNLAKRLGIVATNDKDKLVLLKKDDEGVLRPEELGTIDQVRSLPDARIQTISGTIRNIAAKLDPQCLKDLDAAVLGEQRNLGETIDPARAEFRQQQNELDWVRSQLRALLGQ